VPADLLYRRAMSKRSIPAGAVVRGTDKGYTHAVLKPGSERPVEKVDQKYPYLRPRDAATLILVRQRGKIPEVLLGCRDAKHAFMPNRYVFPGGRVDPADARVPVATPLDRFVDERLRKAATPQRARALAVAAVRETFEETGLMLAKPLKGGAPEEDFGEHWHGFLDKGFAPALDCLDLIARAVTPPGRPRRFNARFFMARAEDATGEIRHSSELGDIRWVQLDEARELPLPTITGLILGEIGRLVKEPPNRKKQRKIPLFTTVHRRHLMLEE
jgi:8-oxo-dGTP pyrophosphatase MutT (NUDIX family)